MILLRYVNTLFVNLRHSTTPASGPIHIQIEVSTFCNLACVMCSHPSMLTPPRHMSLVQFRQIFDTLRPLKISLSGIGEPFLNPDMLAIIHYASTGGARTITTSNLTVITQPLAREIVASGLDLLKGSIDSTNPEIYRAIRKRDLHHKVIQGLIHIREAKQEMGVNTPHIRLQFVMQKANYKQIPEFLDLAEALGVDAVYFQPLDLAVDEYVDDDLVHELIGGMDKDEFRAVIELAAAKSSHMKIATNLPALTKNFEKIWEKYCLVASPDPASAICLMPWTSAYITVEGDVRPCCSFGASDAMSMGNIFQEDFKNIWNNDKYQQLRENFREGKRKHKICRNCIAPTLWRLVKSSTKFSKFMLFR